MTKTAGNLRDALLRDVHKDKARWAVDHLVRCWGFIKDGYPDLIEADSVEARWMDNRNNDFSLEESIPQEAVSYVVDVRHAEIVFHFTMDKSGIGLDPRGHTFYYHPDDPENIQVWEDGNLQASVIGIVEWFRKKLRLPPASTKWLCGMMGINPDEVEVPVVVPDPPMFSADFDFGFDT